MVYRPSPIPEELEDFLPGFGPTPAEWPPLLMRHIVGGRPTTPEPSPLPPPTPSPLHTPCFSPLYRPSPESPQFDDYLPGFRPTPEPWPPLHIAHGREAAPSPSPSHTPECSPPPSPRKSQKRKIKEEELEDGEVEDEPLPLPLFKRPRKTPAEQGKLRWKPARQPRRDSDHDHMVKW
jgi:hypothetical protein